MSRLFAWLRRVLGIPAPEPPALPVRMDSPEEYWLNRARTAAERCRLVARQARQGAVAARCRDVAAQAAASLETMERVAGQASLLHRTLAGMNRSGLRAEESRLRAALTTGPEETRDGIERAVASIQGQERVAARLEQTQAGLLGRLEASAMELEVLNAGLSEVVALAETGGIEGEQRLERLGREVEGLRQGLVEAVDAGRLALERPGGAAAPGTDASPPAPEAAGPPPAVTATAIASPIVPVTDDPQRTS
ncbi:MAG: hypothetical protein NVSMB29_08940 [Candidatus Dormibacteria bacterium]